MAHALHLISSHADDAIVTPPAILEFIAAAVEVPLPPARRDQGRPVRLAEPQADRDVRDEHAAGVRLDRRRLDRTSSPRREVKLTGMPRFDRLHEVGQRFGPDQRDLVLVAPTWRNGLMPHARCPGTQRRTLDAAVIAESEFMRSWRAFLESDELARRGAAPRRRGSRFLPHPNLQPVLDAARPARPRRAALLRRRRRAGVLRPRPGLRHRLLLGGVQRGLPRATGRLLPVRRGRGARRRPRRAGGLLRLPPRRLRSGDRRRARGGGGSGRPRSTTARTRWSPTARRIEATFPDRDGRCSERVVQAVRRTMRDRSQDPPVPTPAGPRHPVPARPGATP